jgi:hypothetical protein
MTNPNQILQFEFSGSIVSHTLASSGIYKIGVWIAAGGRCNKPKGAYLSFV